MNAALTALDFAAVRDLEEFPDPVASVYLGLEPETPTRNPEQLRLRSALGKLADQGADGATIEAVRAWADEITPYPGELAVFAAGGQVRLAQSLPGHVRTDRVFFGAPAHLVPLMRWLQEHPAYAVVIIDRTGADITAVRAGAASGSTWEVKGPDDEIERNAPGGWSQPRYQRRAEDSWSHNAGAVAEEVIRTTRELAAGLLLVAGDVRAVQLLEDHLPPAMLRQVALHRLPGGRSPDGSAERRRELTVEIVERYAAERTAALLEEFAAERTHGTATAGASATLEALARGQVRCLFVVDDPGDARTAWFGPALLCAADESQLPPADARWVKGRLVDVAVRAAVLTDAEIRVIDGGMDEGIGALCRFVAPA
jgi:hypothetical protein